MAIYPLKNYKVANYDVLRASTFKSGMILFYDNNGYAIKADRSLASSDNPREQLSKFLGFASSDHDLLNNIIMSDPVGSSYLDSNNRLIDNVNNLYSQLKRSINEFSDESISRYYNLSDKRNTSERGVGVFNLEGEIFATDQFVAVSAFTIYADSTTTTTLSPGDLLTIGAGVNAGKLVKVDTSGFGPNVIICGIVESHDSSTNTLYFRHILNVYINTPSLFTTGITLNLDANNPASNPGSGTVWNDLSGNSLNGSLLNGAYFENNYVVTDGTNDYVEVLANALLDFPGDFTVESLYKAKGSSLYSMISKRNPGGGGVGVWSYASFFTTGVFWHSVGGGGPFYFVSYNLTKEDWYLFTASRISGVVYLYINGQAIGSVATAYDYTNTYNLRISQWDNGVYNPSNIAAVRVYKGVGLTQDQIRQNLHAQIGNYV